MVRSPASIWLWAFAQGMLLPNWLTGWSVVLVVALMYIPLLDVPAGTAHSSVLFSGSE